MKICPTCGHVLENGHNISVDLQTNSVMVVEENIKLRPKEAEILWLLCKAMPRPITRDYIMYNLYVNDPDEPVNTTINVQISRLRRILRDTPAKITSGRHGYSLHLG